MASPAHHNKAATPPDPGREALGMRGRPPPMDPMAAMLALVELLAEQAAEEHYEQLRDDGAAAPAE